MKAQLAMAAITAASAAFASGAVQARDVSWSVTIGSPHPAPRVIYAPPPVIYTPAPVVYTPAPVVYQQVVYAQPVYRIPPGHLKKWHKHGHRYPGAVVYAPPRGQYHD